MSTALKHLIVREFNGHQVDTLFYNGRQCWISSQVSLAWGYKASWRLAEMIQRWKGAYPGQFRPGKEYERLEGSELKALREATRSQRVASTKKQGNYSSHEYLLYKSGLEAALTKTHKPIGARFVNWLTDEYLPAGEAYAETRDTAALDAALHLKYDDDEVMVHLSRFMHAVTRRQGKFELMLSTTNGEVKTLNAKMEMEIYERKQETLDLKRILHTTQKRRLKSAQRYAEEELKEVIRQALFEFAAYCCLKCGRVMRLHTDAHDLARCEIDHVEDAQLSGNFDWLNLQPLCHACHAEKTRARHRKDFRLYAWDFREKHPEFLAACKREAEKSARRQTAQPLWQGFFPQDCCLEHIAHA